MPENELSPIEKIRAAKAERAKLEAEAAANLEADRVAAEAKESRRGELSFEREQAAAGRVAAEQAAGAAKAEADEARAIKAEMGADIDADTAAAFEAVFAAETKANADLGKVNADLARIDEDIKALESVDEAEKTAKDVASAETPLSIEQVKDHIASYDLEQQHPYEGKGAQDFLNEVEESTVESLANMDPESFELLRTTVEKVINRYPKSVQAYQAVNIRSNLKDAEALIRVKQNKTEKGAA